MSSTSCATSRRTSKAQSFRHVRTCLHKACKDAVRWGRLPKNPVDVADPPSTRGAAKKELKTWHAKQLRGFRKSTKDNRFAHLWRVPAMTGMRRGEAWVERLLRSAIGGLHDLEPRIEMALCRNIAAPTDAMPTRLLVPV